MSMVSLVNANSTADPLCQIVNSERFGRDVSALMNSSFWVDALKKGFAHGVGDQLNSELNTAHEFIKIFVKNFIEIRQVLFKNHIYVIDDIDLCTDEDLTKIDSLITTTPAAQPLLANTTSPFCNNNNDENYFQNNQKYFTRFLIECSYLCILESTNFLGTTNSISNKIREWFPDVKIKSIILKCKLEVLLKRSPHFKRLVNYDKTNIKPIILEKRQKLWSIDSNYLKSFVRNFQHIQKLHILNSYYSKNLLSNYKLSIKTWKMRVEQVKLLMQVKHNGYLWLNNITKTTSSSTTDINRFIFSQRYEPFHQQQQRTPTKHERKNVILSSTHHHHHHHHHHHVHQTTTYHTTNFLYSPESTLITAPICPTSLFQLPSINSHSVVEQFFNDNLHDDDDNDNNEISLETFMF